MTQVLSELFDLLSSLESMALLLVPEGYSLLAEPIPCDPITDVRARRLA